MLPELERIRRGVGTGLLYCFGVESEPWVGRLRRRLLSCAEWESHRGLSIYEDLDIPNKELALGYIGRMSAVAGHTGEVQ